MGIHYNTEGEMDLLDYLINPEVFDVDEEGHVSLLSGPGLGIRMNEEKIRQHAVPYLQLWVSMADVMCW